MLILIAVLMGTTVMAGNPSAKADLIKTKLTGTVTDAISKDALTGVLVQLEGSTQKYYTDFDGNFEITYTGDDNPRVYFSYISYNDEIVEVNLPASTNLNVQLNGK